MKEKTNNWKAWLYLAPVLLLMAVFTFFPIVNTFVVSFLKDYNVATGESSGFTLFNYAYVLGFAERYKGSGVYNKTFFSWDSPSAFSNTMLITFVTVPISVILSLVIAIAIHHIKFLRKFFQTVFFMPYVTNVIAVGMVLAIMFSSGGIINKIFNLHTQWLSPTQSSWWSCMFVLMLYIIWQALPYKILIFLSGLEGIDQQYYDAAAVDGASRVKTSVKVTIPLLSPQILYITVTSFITAFKEYSSVVGLINRSNHVQGSGHDLYTIVYYIFDQMESTNWLKSTQYASAAAVILFVLIFGFTFIELQISKRRVHY